jgi:hypothetical protein
MSNRPARARHGTQGVGPAWHVVPPRPYRPRLRAWLTAQARPVGPLFVLSWPEKHATANGPGQPEAHRMLTERERSGKGRQGQLHEPREVVVAVCSPLRSLRPVPPCHMPTTSGPHATTSSPQTATPWTRRSSARPCPNGRAWLQPPPLRLLRRAARCC